MKITDKRFRYHNAASHATSDGFKRRMRRYARVRMQEARAIVTPINREKGAAK